jgi:hypothetical protein
MLTKEISDIEKGCGGHINKGDCSKGYLCEVCRAKLSTLKSAQKIVKKEIEKLNKIIFKGRHYKTNYWELYYPDGTSTMMNYDPIKSAQRKFDKFVEDLIKKSESYDLNSAEAIQFRNAINKKIDELSSKEKKDE